MERLLITSIFCLSHDVYERGSPQSGQNQRFDQFKSIADENLTILLSDINLDCSKLKAFADDKINVIQKLKFIME